MRLSSLPQILIPALAFLAPSFAATLHGTVTDASGQPVFHSRVRVFSRDRQEQVSTYTDELGRYRIESIAGGDYLVQADSQDLARSAARLLTIQASDSAGLDFTLGLAEVRTEIVVTATGAAQSTDEIAKSVDSVYAADMARNAEFSATEALRSLPGMRIQTLGGPGAFTRIMSRGLRPQDTAVTIDGLRFRDAATTQGDATPFLEDLVLVNTERIEVLRGTGSSIYGSNAIGGVVNLVTDTGGGPLHGDVKAEGGGLGMMRGLARLAGGSAAGRLNFSAGVQHMNVLSGRDGNDRYRTTSGQGSLQWRPGSTTSLSGHLWAADSFSQLNSPPYAAPAGNLPPRGAIRAIPVSLDVQHRIEAGLPFSYGNANFVPDLNDPDSSRSARFLSGAVIFNHQLTPHVSYCLSYHKVLTRRWFDDGPAGTQFPPPFSVSDRIHGGTDTVTAQTAMQLASWNQFSAGYEFERETYNSTHLDFAPASLAQDYFTAAGQKDHSVFFNDQFRLIESRLQIGISGRIQRFALPTPEFTGGASPYQGIAFRAPRNAKTGDLSAAYLVAGTGTKLRAHVGNGYRAPSIFERFGSTFFEGSFTPLGDPRLRPERTIAFDTGIDQYLLSQKVRISATWFYTNLQETIVFDFSGFLVPSQDPFARSSGYINTGGGIARGAELSMEASATQTLKLTAAYTYTNAAVRRSTVRDRDFFRMPFISPHQFSFTATQRLGRRIDLVGDVWIASEHPAIFSNRAFLFAGPRKVDLVGNYTVPLHDRTRVRFYGKVTNLLASEYLEGGYRAPGRWGIGGVSLEF